MGNIKRNLLYNTAYQILVILIPLVTTPYVSRVLGPQNIGEYSYSYSVASYFVMFIMLGLNNYGNRTIADYKNNKKKLSKTFFSIYVMQLLTGLMVNIIYIIYCFNYSNDIIVSLALGFYVLSGIFDINWFFFGMETFKLTVLRNSIVKLITTISIFLFVKSQDDLLAYCIILSLGTLISQLILWIYVPKYVERVQINLQDVIVHIKPNLYLFLTVIGVSMYKTLAKIMLGSMCSKQELGYFESAEKIVNIPIVLVTSLGTVMLPRMTSLLSNNENNKFSEYIDNSIKFAMLTSSAMCFGIMAVSKSFIPLFYGNGYEKCVYLYLVLLPSCLFLAFGNVIRTQYLLPKKNDRIYIISAFIGAIVNIVINFVLIPIMGSIGAAFSTLAAEISVCVYQASKTRKNLPIRKYIMNSMQYIFSGFVMFIVVFFINIETESLIINLLVKIGIGIAIYSLLTLLIILIRLKYKKFFK